MSEETVTKAANNQDLPPGIANAARQAAEGGTQRPAPKQPVADPNAQVVTGDDEPKGNEGDPAADSAIFGDRYNEDAETEESDEPADKIESEVNTEPKDGDFFESIVGDEAIKPAIVYLDQLTNKYDVDVDRAFSKAIEYNDPSLIDSHYLNELLGEDADGYIKQASATMTHINASITKQTEQVYAGIDGGKEAFDASIEAFNKTADDVTRKQVKLMFNSGDTALMKAAAEVVVNFGKDNGKVIVHKKPPLGNPSASKGLTSQEYRKAIAELTSKPRYSNAEYEELRAKRQLGMKQGLK